MITPAAREIWEKLAGGDDVEAVRECVETGRVGINEIVKRGLCGSQTMLNVAVAVAGGRVESVKFLLRCPGIDVNWRGDSRFTPLFDAIDHPAIFQSLAMDLRTDLSIKIEDEDEDDTFDAAGDYLRRSIDYNEQNYPENNRPGWVQEKIDLYKDDIAILERAEEKRRRCNRFNLDIIEKYKGIPNDVLVVNILPYIEYAPAFSN